jgi:hypothetical protein
MNAFCSLSGGDFNQFGVQPHDRQGIVNRLPMERRHIPIAQNKVSFRPIASDHDQSDAVKDLAADDNLIGIHGFAGEIYPDSIHIHVIPPFSRLFDGLVKSPSAALRCNFVVAAHL